MTLDQTRDLLAKICHKLSSGSLSGQGAYNYEVDAELLYGESKSALSEIEMIEKLAPNFVVGGIEKIDLSDLLAQVYEGFNFRGDESSHPNLIYLGSGEFKRDFDELIGQINLLVSENSGVSAFWLKEGHPFYPVYWDYAFLIRKTDGYFVLIGSSSD